MSVQLGLGLNRRQGGFNPFNPTHLNPYLLFDTRTSMLGELESPTLDLDPAVPSSLDVITATRSGVATYTDADGLIQTADPNTVRIDHVDGVPMMLIEPSSTNLVDYSNLDYSGVWNETGFEVIQNAIESPDGLNNGVKMVQTSTTRNFVGSFIQSSVGTSVTYSFWVKKGSDALHLNRFIIRNHSSSDNMVGGINLETGEILINQFGEGNLSVEPYPNGWFKVKATRDTGINIGDEIKIYPPYYTNGENEIGQYVYTFGHQLEYGSVATSYIPTNGSAVTRNADQLSITGSNFTNFFNSGGDGTFYAEFIPRDVLGEQWYLLAAQDYDRRFMYTNVGNARLNAYDGTTTRSYGQDMVANQLNRAAITYTSTTQEASLDGSTTAPATYNGNYSTASILYLSSPVNDRQMNGHLKRLIYWPTHSDNL